MSIQNAGKITSDWLDMAYDSTSSVTADNLAYDSTSTIKTKLSSLIALTMSNVVIDTFVLDGTDISNAYVTLSKPVDSDDIDLTVAGAPGQKYDTDYTMTTTTRLSWNGLGLGEANQLEIGDVLTIVYKTPV